MKRESGKGVLVLSPEMAVHPVSPESFTGEEKRETRKRRSRRREREKK